MNDKIDSFKVSIIIPTFNVENYIEQCLQSILEQEYKNIEIILVDDGSTDNTLNIINEIAKKNDNIIIISQKNAGSGPARNNGISHATGEYIMFIDGDDWIEHNMISEYMKIQKDTGGVDLITSSYVEENFNKNVHTSINRNVKHEFFSNIEDVRKHYIHLYLNELINAPHRILYKRKIIIDNDIKFPDLRRSQDIVFNYRYYNYVTSIYVDSNIYYHYRIEEKVYLHKLKKEYVDTIKLIYNDICELLKKWKVNISEKEWQQFNNNFLVMLGYYIEARILNKEDFSIVYNDKVLEGILEASKPIDKYHKILKNSLIKKSKNMTYMIIKLKIFVKKNFYYFFKKLKKIKKY